MPPPVTFCDVFSFLWRSIITTITMPCFFSCFRVPHHHQNPPSSPPPTTEAETQKIRLSSLFTDQGGEERVVEEQENVVRRVGWSDIDQQLVEEAKFLKSCGTLPQTPAELRKRVARVEDQAQSDTQEAHSLLKDSAESHIGLEKPETCPEDPVGMDVESSHGLLEASPKSPEEIQPAEASAKNLQKSELRGPRSVVKSPPYPTPMKITDDMQTPGTVFATNMKHLSRGKARIRSQYVYTVLNPIENLSEQEELKEENCVLEGESDHKEENLPEGGNGTPSSVMGIKKENMGDATLASWLKPPRPTDEGDCHNTRAASRRKPDVGKDVGDRPIIGLVAAHWNEQEEETSNVSPKWWDGNGIPNSTTKYKEDQKVRWHATPFEERLEKALSEETFPPRKHITGAPMMLDEIEGDDTATSHVQSISCP